MNVALLIAQSRVSPVFETTSTFLIVDASLSEYSRGNIHYFNTQNEVAMVNELLAHNIDLVICGAIPYYLEKILINQGCDVFSFIAGEVDEVIAALHLNLLDKPKFKMPGCKKRKQRGKNPFCQRALN